MRLRLRVAFALLVVSGRSLSGTASSVVIYESTQPSMDCNRPACYFERKRPLRTIGTYDMADYRKLWKLSSSVNGDHLTEDHVV